MLHRIVRSATLLAGLLCLSASASAVAQTIHVMHGANPPSDAPSVSEAFTPAQLLEANGGDGVVDVDEPEAGSITKDVSFDGLDGSVPPGPDGSFDGTDPAKTGCSADARSPKHKSLYANGRKVAVIELRYSSRCRTAWGRITSSYVNCQSPGTWCGDVQIFRNDGKNFGCSSKTGDRGCYTPQVNDAGYRTYAWGCIMYAPYENVCGRTEAF